jgi:hypothetical protein
MLDEASRSQGGRSFKALRLYFHIELLEEARGEGWF